MTPYYIRKAHQETFSKRKGLISSQVNMVSTQGPGLKRDDPRESRSRHHVKMAIRTPLPLFTLKLLASPVAGQIHNKDTSPFSLSLNFSHFTCFECFLNFLQAARNLTLSFHVSVAFYVVERERERRKHHRNYGRLCASVQNQ